MKEETTLADLRVLDLSTGVAGALCGRLFADYGADVIAIARPGQSPPLAQGKRCVSLNISTDTGGRLFRAMVEKANVVIEMFPAGTLEALGLAFPQLQAIKRRIIVVSVQDGADEASSRLAGLNAFAAASLAAFNADSHEIPQHIRIVAEECAAAVSGMPAGSIADDALFTISTVEWARGETPTPGEHNTEILAELDVTSEELAQLRAEGVV